MNAIDLAQNIINSIEEVRNELIRVDRDIKTCDLEACDILHDIELTAFNAYEGYKLAKELQKIRIKRRELKDYEEQLEILKRFYKNHKTACNEVRELINAIETRQEQQLHRIYSPRVRTDLKIIRVRAALQPAK